MFQKTEVKQHMTRSLSVPVNVKARSLRRMDSGGMIRVISATPRPPIVEGASPDDVPAVEIGKFDHYVLSVFFIHLYIYQFMFNALQRGEKKNVIKGYGSYGLKRSNWQILYFQAYAFVNSSPSPKQ